MFYDGYSADFEHSIILGHVFKLILQLLLAR